MSLFFYVSHTLWDVLSGGVLSPVSFSSIWKKRRWQHTFRQSDIQYDGWRRNAKRREKQNKTKQTIKKTAPNLCQECFLYCEIVQIFKLMGLILSAPKTPASVLTFNVIGFPCMLGGGWCRRWGWLGVGGGLRLQWMSPYLLSQSSTFNPSPSRGLWDSLAMMPVKWDQ